MFYTVIKRDGHLKTREKCEKHEPTAWSYTAALDFSQTSLVFISGYVNTANVFYLLNIEREFTSWKVHAYGFYSRVVKYRNERRASLQASEF
jgi:hypothetical protein